MKNIWVILKREYTVRVKNKTFVIMTFLAPILIGLFYGGSIYLATKGAEDNTLKKIYIEGNESLCKSMDKTYDNFKFIIPDKNTNVEKELSEEKVDGWLILNDMDLRFLDSSQLIVKNSFSLNTKSSLNTFIKTQATKILLQSKGITQATIDSSEALGNISMIEENELGEKQQSSTEIKSAVGLVMSLVIYMFIFIYGSMVMRSAMEEKTNRIVEVIVSSVKPFELMLGKILGVALVGLTQFMAWILLSFTLVLGIGKYFNIALENSKNLPNTGGKQEIIQSAMDQSNILESIGQLPYAQIITVFFIFFLGGYLLYSSVFAAIGSAVNQETDVQQFMFPVSMPLIFGIIIAQSVVFQSPNGELAKIFSMIPFTSPILMCVRVPFGVSWTEIFTSALILYTTFFLMVWLSAKIYRIGILMYGKKPTWKDFAKWIRQ
jgi:ABC-2 type transport system permease protein